MPDILHARVRAAIEHRLTLARAAGPILFKALCDFTWWDPMACDNHECMTIGFHLAHRCCCGKAKFAAVATVTPKPPRRTGHFNRRRG
jgi:hypothetical protein